MFVSGVNNTGDKRKIFFPFFVKILVECTLHLKMEFLHIFHFHRQDCLIGGVIDTGEKFFSGVVDTGKRF
jgi:hypothetical protein